MVGVQKASGGSMFKRLFVPGVLVLYSIVRGTLDTIGYVDLVIAHREAKTTWLGELADFLMQLLFAPPAWVPIPMVVIGLVWIWLDLKRPFGPKFVPLDDAALRLYEMDEAAGDEWSGIASGAKSAVAKLEYFKQFLVEFAPLYGKRVPSTQLRLIPEGMRRQLYATEGARNALTDGVVLTEPAYTDVSIRKKDLSRAGKRYRGDLRGVSLPKTEKGSPRSAAKAPERIPFLDFLDGAARGGWPIDFYDTRWDQFLRDLRQASSDGTVAIWGRRIMKADGRSLYREYEPPVEPLLLIPKEHWATFEVEKLSLFHHTPRFACSHNPKLSDWGMSTGRYKDLHVGTGATEWLAGMKVPPR